MVRRRRNSSEVGWSSTFANGFLRVFEISGFERKVLSSFRGGLVFVKIEFFQRAVYIV